MNGRSAVVIKRFQSLLFMLFASACLALSAGAASAAPHGDRDGVESHYGDRSDLVLPVTGTFAPSANPGPMSSLGSGVLAGTFNIQRFERESLQVVAIGTLVGTLTNGNRVRTVVKVPVTLPLALTPQVAGSGTVTLPLGPVSVDAAGLTINLNASSVSITHPGSLPETLLNDLTTSINDLVTGAAQLTVTIINGLVALLNQIPGQIV